MRSTALACLLTLTAFPVLAQQPAPDVTAVADGDRAFACDLYQALRDQPGNLFFSPASVSQALGLAYAGARGDTATELEKALHVDLPAARWLAGRHDLSQALASRGKGARGRDGQPFRLHMADRAWGQDGYHFLPAYLKQLEGCGAELGRVDFVSATEDARQTINAWISEQTEERIPELLQPGDVTAAARLVLTDAVYFNAAWQKQFETTATQPGTFHREGQGDVQVPFMGQSEMFYFARGEGWQAVELPYQGNDVSMLIVVPDAGTFAKFEAGFDAQRLEGILKARGGYQTVDLRLPRFRSRCRFELKDALAKVGLDRSFVYGEADFSGMDGTRELFIARVIHEAVVEVDESGTEAAAATAVEMDAGCMPQEPIQLHVDRPFLYLIRDRQTGEVLFMGRMLDPTPAEEK